MNNRTLFILFISGLLLFFGGRYWRASRSVAFNPQILTVDTAKVDRISFLASGDPSNAFELQRNGQAWKAVKGTVAVVAKPQAVAAVLSPLADLQANRIISRDVGQYATYEIDDAKAGRLTAWAGNRKVADLLMGGFRFDQAAQSATTFVRKADADEVYEIDGFKNMGLKARFDQFRDKRLVKTSADDLTGITWSNAMGHKQAIVKEEGAWYYAGMEAVDSSAFSNYLDGLVNVQGSAFSDLTSVQGLLMIEKLTLQTTSASDPVTITGYAAQDSLKPFLIASTANPEAIFISDSLGLYKNVFTDLRKFWPDGQ